MMNPTPPQPDLSYYPSDYALDKATPLHYIVDPSSPASGPLLGRPVPLADLYPVFSTSPAIRMSPETPIPIARLCDAGPSGAGGYSPGGPGDSTSSLALCVMDACKEQLARVSAAKATYEALIRGVSGNVGAGGEEVVRHFNAHNALEECSILNCPTEYFLSHSTLCVSLRHPYFTQRNIFLPTLPPVYSPNSTLVADLQNAQVLADHHSQVRTRAPPARAAGFSGAILDLGIHLPALPAGFPCDPARTDQSSGVILPPTTIGDSDPSSRSHSSYVTNTGTWVSNADNSQWALAHNATPGDGQGAVHVWMVKSTVFRGGIDALGTTSAGSLREVLATGPANVYALGHCPRSTRQVVGSKVAGEACAKSIECVFSMCVEGKCAAAAGGKQVGSAVDALASMRDTKFGRMDRAGRATAAWWMCLVGEVVGGLVVVRIVQLVVRRWWVKRRRGKDGVRAREMDQAPVMETVVAVTVD